jgi:hypothetical protein
MLSRRRRSIYTELPVVSRRKSERTLVAKYRRRRRSPPTERAGLGRQGRSGQSTGGWRYRRQRLGCRIDRDQRHDHYSTDPLDRTLVLKGVSMALIACSECGRAVSEKAPACIGCGAPLSTSSSIDLVPRRSNSPPPTREQIKRRVLLSLTMLVLGVILANLLDHRPDSRAPSFVAALLIICGLSWFMVVLIHAVSSRR